MNEWQSKVPTRLKMHLLLQMVIFHCHVMLVFWKGIVAISLECHSFVVLEGNLINTTSPTMSYGLTLSTLTVEFSALKIFLHFLCILQKFWETFWRLHVFGSGKKYFTWHPTHFGQADKLLDALEAESTTVLSFPPDRFLVPGVRAQIGDNYRPSHQERHWVRLFDSRLSSQHCNLHQSYIPLSIFEGPCNHSWQVRCVQEDAGSWILKPALWCTGPLITPQFKIGGWI